ncbi:MAG: ribosome biogenesis GTPase YlqF [Lactobacillaceae bacterium]|jgi:ribosome biogenesis GTPase A|nr:ribosome biogenesis GTPase YlqF [Lactobacillaceae bacterium]
MTQQIQWYPGHMAKTLREIGEQIHLVDFVLQIVDARAPQSTQNNQVLQVTGDRPVILVLNKFDLADPKEANIFARQNADKFAGILKTDSKSSLMAKDFSKELNKLQVIKDIREKKSGDISLKALVVGTPNVGKSTFINHLAGKNIARTANMPGVTKNLYWIRTKYDMDLLDTPGLLWPKFEDQEVGLKIAMIGGIKDSLLPIDDVAVWFIGFVQKHYPTAIAERYKLGHFSLEEPANTLVSLTAQMGFKQDYDRASEKLIREFREGKFGRMSLDYYSDED